MNVRGLAVGLPLKHILQHNNIRNYSLSVKQVLSIWEQGRVSGNENMIIIIKNTREDSKMILENLPKGWIKR